MLNSDTLNTLFRSKPRKAPKMTGAQRTKEKYRKEFEKYVGIADKYNDSDLDGASHKKEEVSLGWNGDVPELKKRDIDHLSLESSKNGFELSVTTDKYQGSSVKKFAFDGDHVTVTKLERESNKDISGFCEYTGGHQTIKGSRQKLDVLAVFSV